jgi:aspartyl-tRNA(Asn)/glutamyl-tRNA(Gln) amidotransferase subunit B
MSKSLEEINKDYEIVVGLEIHAQLNTKSKVYSSDKNEFGSLPNHNVTAISLGHPGTLPRVNSKVLDHAIRLGLAFKSEIRRDMHFSRKNYFYADLPKGYQITQDDTPICNGGGITIKTEEGEDKFITLTRIHIEEDAGKSIHDIDPFNSLIDLNRAGVPLLEIVSEPEMRSGKEAYNYLTEVRKLVRYLEVCDGNMEEGSMRCDANVSVMKKGAKEFGNRVEVKNMNSIRNVQRAIEYEAVRHVEILENGGTIETDTRSYWADSNTTTSMRKKEGAHDYRYFPEPDLQPIHLNQEHIDEVAANMPPLPHELFAKYTKQYGLSEYDAGVITDSKPIALFYEELVANSKNYKDAANWIMGGIKSYLNKHAIGVDQFPITAANMAGLIALIDDGKVTKNLAQGKIFPLMLEQSDKSAEAIAEENGWLQENDNSDELAGLMQAAMDKHAGKVEAYRAGNKNLMGLFMGEVMRGSGGTADPAVVNKLVREMLEG